MAFRSIKKPTIARAYIPKPHMPRWKATFRVRITNRGHKIADYMRRWEIEFLKRSGAALKTYVIRSFKVVKKKKDHSPVGKAPHLHKPKSTFIRIAIQYFVDYRAREMVVGPIYSKAKLWGWKHEFGKTHGVSKKGVPMRYPPRPFMGPQFRRWWKYGRPKIMKDIASKMRSGK